jgi:hypothetical protein
MDWWVVAVVFPGALCTLMAALVTVEQQSGNAALMGLLLSYALQVRLLHKGCCDKRKNVQHCMDEPLSEPLGMTQEQQLIALLLVCGSGLMRGRSAS